MAAIPITTKKARPVSSDSGSSVSSKENSEKGEAPAAMINIDDLKKARRIIHQQKP